MKIFQIEWSDLMRKETLFITSVQKIAHETFEMKMKNRYISQKATPGQFLHVSVQNFTLRRPLSIAAIDHEREQVTIIFKAFGPGTKALSTYRPGMLLDAIGPIGNGFPLKPLKKALLIGGGVGIPPLYFLGKELVKQGIDLTVLLGFQNKESIFYDDEFQQMGKMRVATNDGSYGHHGYVTDLLKEVEDYEQYYACGPLPMLKAVQTQLADKKGYLSLEERMGCGVGACLACVVPTDENGGYQKICQDGPVFQAEEIIL